MLHRPDARAEDLTADRKLFSTWEKENLPQLNKTGIKFLPPKITKKVQPFYAGIMAWVNAKYNRRLLFRTFDNINVGKKSIYIVDNVNVLMAMD